MFPTLFPTFFLLRMVLCPSFSLLVVALGVSVSFGWADEAVQPTSKNVFTKMEDLTALDLTYQVYTSGFHVATQDISFIKNEDKLHIHSKITTNAALSWLQDSTAVLEVIEQINPDMNTPLTFRTDFNFSSFLSKKRSAVYVNYGKDGQSSYGFVPIKNIESDEHPASYEKKYTQNTTNWLSLMSKIANLSAQESNFCEMEERIFDVSGGVGVKFRSAKKVNVTNSNRFTSYRGEATRCKVVFSPFPPKGQPRGKSSTGDIVLANIVNDFHMPIRFFVASSEPRIILHLSDYGIRKVPDFQPLNLLSEIPY